MKPITRSNKPRNWTRRQVNRALKAKGLIQADIVREVGRSQSLVSEVVGGELKSLPVALVVAGHLGLRPCDIWPRLYEAPATPTDAARTEPTVPGPRALAS